jgi:hypothetical protein
MAVLRATSLLAILCCAPLCLAACSGIETTAFDDDSGAPSDDAIAQDSTPGDDAALDTTPSPDAAPDATPVDAQPETPTPTTLANVCTRWSEAICAQPTKDCCVKRSIGYDAAGCSKAVQAWCGSLVSQVKASKRTFNAGEFDACANAWRTLETTCSVPFPVFVKTYAPCAQLFPGTVAPGGDCTDDTDCIAPPGGVAFCSASNKCSTTRVVAKGEACSYDTTQLILCEAGSYCPTTGSAPKCKAATAVGGSCTNANDPSCGLGYQCAQASITSPYQCKVGLAAGAKCTNGMQCASWTCDGATPFGAGTCTDPYAQMASPAICNGTP